MYLLNSSDTIYFNVFFLKNESKTMLKYNYIKYFKKQFQDEKFVEN